VEEAHRIRERVLDQHALCIAGNQLGRGAAPVIGEQDGGLIVTEVLDEQLTEARAGQRV
jgi:hypothetical protein